ncbi:peptide-N(4)-(N-acetyl-beta-glucosaminyl)asparagine amidase-like [Puntigrus tetrazona]|uniref:peptide-N(4)-(N-acetyl-beta- glucosaminyl)asparagine amidase n=1 Tax=Puntigrus tetrazona TaxID=1606681 RepID=UPI001C8A8664|nr:peptide-N(4)-(N-acetyl-beta-glucosaminyl)asparagine amidase [Puntigrus tetrazona]XP_043094259.1 peptide-N(4)-(N-acetyl-beta-glucosaminyl)asparagine amidase-like [Puntigrus tetrazona]
MSGSQGVIALCENTTEVFLDVSKLLITYADNILRNPNEDKYRSIRIGNPTFSTKLLPVKGAIECLFEMGFEEAETHLVFPKSASVERLRQVRESIAAERDQRLGTSKAASNQQSHPPPPAGPSASSSSAISTPAPAPPPAALPFTLSSGTFQKTVQSNFQHVLIYESPELQQKALSCIPHELLRSRAKERLKQAKDVEPACNLDEEDMLVLELLQWFKGDFFTWVDNLPCSRCGGPTQPSGPLSPSDDDLRWNAGRVENHFCHTCQLSTRFPRYNNPEKLLETRRGRCGEWANCFTLLCRALCLEARYIWDSTDHVWTEVYSQSQCRWLHCDPCENACDKPLLYEIGWGKKLSYILAFSKDQVVDVTWRYSCKHPEVLSRRTHIQETRLLQTLNGLNATRQQALGAERKQQLLQRLLVELVEFISPKTPTSGELGGRISGSLAWRVARGESGASDTKGEEQECVFIPSESEKQKKLFHISYNVTKNCYFRVSNGQETIPGWQRGAWRTENMFRKEENDWHMVYLARTEGSSFGRISWKMNFAPVGMKIKSTSVRAFSQTFHSGSVRWSLRSAETTIEFPGDGELHSSSSLSGGKELIVEAELSGGEGEVSWQHAQLFRQSIKDTEKVLFEILVEMEES